MTVTLDLIERGLRAGLPEGRAMVVTPEAALAVAERLLREDPDGTRDFDRAEHLAGYLRHVAAHGHVNESALAVPEPDPTPLWRASWDRSAELRDEFHGDLDAFLAYCRNEHRHGREVPDVAAAEPQPAKVTTSTMATPAAAPAVAPARVAAPAPAAVLAHPKPTANSVRLSLAECSAKLGIGPLDALPRGRVALALKQAGITWTEGDDGELQLSRDDVERLTADPAKLEHLLLALSRAVPSLGHVGSGHEVSMR